MERVVKILGLYIAVFWLARFDFSGHCIGLSSGVLKRFSAIVLYILLHFIGSLHCRAFYHLPILTSIFRKSCCMEYGQG